MEKKIYTYESEFGSIEVVLEKTTYNYNGTLALVLHCKPSPDELECYDQEQIKENPFVETFGVATVNLPNSAMLEEDEQFVDENNLPGIGKFLEDNGIAIPLGFSAASGFCSYPAYKFNI